MPNEINLLNSLLPVIWVLIYGGLSLLLCLIVLSWCSRESFTNPEADTGESGTVPNPYNEHSEATGLWQYGLFERTGGSQYLMFKTNVS